MQDTLANLPFLGQPIPWSIVVALGIVLLYVAVRSGYSLPTESGLTEVGPRSNGRAEQTAQSTRSHDEATRRIKEWYHGGQGLLMLQKADRLIDMAVHVLPSGSLHRDLGRPVTFLRQKLTDARTDLGMMHDGMHGVEAIDRLTDSVNWYHAVVGLAAAMARTNPQRWSSEKNFVTAYEEWATAHGPAAAALAGVMGTDAFMEIRDTLNGLMEAPDFAPSGSEDDDLSRVVSAGQRVLQQQRESKR